MLYGQIVHIDWSYDSTSCLLVECMTLWGEPKWVHVQAMEQLNLRSQYVTQKCTRLYNTGTVSQA